MPRTTKADIRQVETVINNRLQRKGYNIRIWCEWAYGRPRAYWGHIGNDSRYELSPRLPIGELYRWFQAFDCGLNLGLMDETWNPLYQRKE